MRLARRLIVLLMAMVLIAANGRAQRVGKCQGLRGSLQALIDRAVAQGLPGVTVTAVTPDCGQIEAVSGYADLKNRIKMTPQAAFKLASCSKPYIGVVIMQLVEEGRLSLDDQISKYLPEKYVANIRNTEGATVRQLMNHTSGIYDYYFDENFAKAAEANPGKLYSMAEALEFAYGKAPAFTPPGGGYFYSNTNTILLGVIIEKVLNVPVAQALRRRIFQPLKLEHTYSDYHEPVIEPLARGYFLTRDGRRLDYTDVNQGYGLPDGIVVSSGGDMITFLRALLRDERLLKAKSVAELLVVDEAARRGPHGLNLFVYDNYLNGAYGRMIGHDGEYGGYRSEMFHFPARDTTVVLLTNGSGRKVNALWSRLYRNIAEVVNR